MKQPREDASTRIGCVVPCRRSPSRTTALRSVGMMVVSSLTASMSSSCGSPDTTAKPRCGYGPTPEMALTTPEAATHAGSRARDPTRCTCRVHLPPIARHQGNAAGAKGVPPGRLYTSEDQDCRTVTVRLGRWHSWRASGPILSCRASLSSTTGSARCSLSTSATLLGGFPHDGQHKRQSLFQETLRREPPSTSYAEEKPVQGAAPSDVPVPPHGPVAFESRRKQGASLRKVGV